MRSVLSSGLGCAAAVATAREATLHRPSGVARGGGPALIVALVLLCCPAPSRAEADWATSFPAATVGTYLPGGQPAVVVIGAGTERDSAACAQALLSTLRASGRAAVVMDAAALGQIAALADREIVKRAAALPVRVVVIARVFPGHGDTETAVVTLYSAQGHTLSAFSTARGTPLAPREAESRQGISTEAASAVSRVLQTERPRARPPTAAEREYQLRTVLIHYAGIERMCRSGEAGWGGPVRGDPPHPLTLRELFAELGRPDYAARTRARERVRTALSIVGAGTALAGASTAALGYLAQRRDPQWALIGGGGAAVGVGLVMLFIGIFMDSSPVPAAEVYRLALDHDRNLRRKLKLPEQTGVTMSPSGRPAVARRVAVAPIAVPGGAGVTCGGEFR